MDALLAARSPAVPLHGRGLRYALSLELLRAGELTVRELVRRLEATGHRIVGRSSKAVSDALRWEIGHGRVVRIGRGRYRTGRIPRSTVWWMRRDLARRSAGWRDGGGGGGDGGGDLTVPPTPVPARRRPTDAPLTGLILYRRQQRAQRAWEATLGPRPTFRRWLRRPA